MKQKSALAIRLLLGLLFFVFGLNGFLNFIPAPPPSGPSGDFATALMNTGYMFPMIKGVEVLVGILLLSGSFVPLALILLAPITVNIFLFHAVLAPETMAMAVVIVILHLYLAWNYKTAYSSLLKRK